jgi:hypothetical protein
MEDRHNSEVAALDGGSNSIKIESGAIKIESGAIPPVGKPDESEDKAAMERQRKLTKIREQKEAERQRILEAERQAILDAKNIGPTMRDVELQQIVQQLQPHHYTIKQIPADGNCLYRAIAAQCSSSKDTAAPMSYTEVRTFSFVLDEIFLLCGRLFQLFVSYRCNV